MLTLGKAISVNYYPNLPITFWLLKCAHEDGDIFTTYKYYVTISWWPSSIIYLPDLNKLNSRGFCFVFCFFNLQILHELGIFPECYIFSTPATKLKKKKKQKFHQCLWEVGFLSLLIPLAGLFHPLRLPLMSSVLLAYCYPGTHENVLTLSRLTCVPPQSVCAVLCVHVRVCACMHVCESEWEEGMKEGRKEGRTRGRKRGKENLAGCIEFQSKFHTMIL